jgi:hypothetical protein
MSDTRPWPLTWADNFGKLPVPEGTEPGLTAERWAEQIRGVFGPTIRVVDINRAIEWLGQRRANGQLRHAPKIADLIDALRKQRSGPAAEAPAEACTYCRGTGWRMVFIDETPERTDRRWTIQNPYEHGRWLLAEMSVYCCCSAGRRTIQREAERARSHGEKFDTDRMAERARQIQQLFQGRGIPWDPSHQPPDNLFSFGSAYRAVRLHLAHTPTASRPAPTREPEPVF